MSRGFWGLALMVYALRLLAWVYNLSGFITFGKAWLVVSRVYLQSKPKLTIPKLEILKTYTPQVVKHLFRRNDKDGRP